jgi:hypothetical protein
VSPAPAFLEAFPEQTPVRLTSDLSRWCLLQTNSRNSHFGDRLYLSAPPTLPEGGVLDAAAKLRVAFVWATRPLTNTDHRNVPLSLFDSLFELDSVAFYSLQVNESAAALEPYLTRPNVHSLKPFIKDMRDTAAFVSKMDLVISIDTGVAHLAGALGAKVWVLLSVNANWRWLKGDRHGIWNEKSPWYPTMRLFRSAKFNDWEPVFRAVRENLVNLIDRQAERNPQLVEVG